MFHLYYSILSIFLTKINEIFLLVFSNSVLLYYSAPLFISIIHLFNLIQICLFQSLYSLISTNYQNYFLIHSLSFTIPLISILKLLKFNLCSLHLTFSIIWIHSTIIPFIPFQVLFLYLIILVLKVIYSNYWNSISGFKNLFLTR